MTKFKGGILLFLVLILVLSSGSSYLALNQTTSNKNDSDGQKMTVALVNEDQGAVFHGRKYKFGDEFVKSVEKDDQRDWYVVSRGVAESGLARNVYNMMIVIPNDFSQKALSIDSKAPEQVVLNYKINASDSSTMKPKAEKAASSILEDFNRRIIDVYFASVLGNLQNAQDNIRTLINKEQQYANIYDGRIHRPLTGYTSQFGAVQDQSKIARDSFSNLQDILKGFRQDLSAGVQSNSAYQSSLNDFTKLKTGNSLPLENFTNLLGSLDSDMNQADVQEQLDQLMSANREINAQFENRNGVTNIMSEAAAIQKYLDIAGEKVSNYNTDLTNKLQADMTQQLSGQLESEIKNSSGGGEKVYLNRFFLNPDENVNKNIQSQIDRLPSLNPDDIGGLGFNDETNIQIQNVIAVTKKYIHEFNYHPNRDADGVPLSDQVNEIKQNLQENGLTLTDAVKLPANEKSTREFTLSIPDQYNVTQILIAMPDKAEVDYTKDFLRDHKVVLPATAEGLFKVKIKVNPNKISAPFDVFQPITWGWKIDLEDADTIETGTGEPSKAKGENSTGLVTSANGKILGILKKTEAGAGNETSLNDGSQTTDPSEDNATNSGQDKTPPEAVEVTNHTISHRVMSPLVDQSIEVLINSVADSISGYQKMMALYNLYFGIGLDQFSQPDLADQLQQTDLKALATEDSLYYLFNKEDIVKVLSRYIAEQITEEVRQETEDLQGKTDAYLQLLSDAESHSLQMAELLQTTHNQANILNDNLAKTLTNLADWRDKSRKLQDDQAKIIEANDEEQSALLSLDDEFKSLLAASQSLADQANSNLNNADQVYKTFAAIDTQAEDIKNSGTNIVKQANDLSKQLMNKLADDKNFANNFADVLANSRIGDRPNENLLHFLSNPVQTKNAGTIATVDTFTPYFIVLICFIVALFTAYVISGYERRKHEDDSFTEERSLVGKNLPITMITASIGVVEGILIGWLSGYFLQIPQEKFISWIGLVTLIMATMLLVGAYLLRQLKMLGMFILLVILSMYLFLTEALGLRYNTLSLAGKVKEYSPLQYVEQLLLGVDNGIADHQIVVVWLVVLIVVSLAGHLLTVNRFAKNEERRNEEMDQNL